MTVRVKVTKFTQALDFKDLIAPSEVHTPYSSFKIVTVNVITH